MKKNYMPGIGFKNMKVFEKEQWFDFNKLTLLTGTNNSGKSSVINAMKLIQNSMVSCTNIDDLLKLEIKVDSNLENKHGSLLNFVNNKAKDVKANKFSFSFQSHIYIYRVIIAIEQGLNSFGRVNSIDVSDKKTKERIFVISPLDGNKKSREYSFNINYEYFTTKFFHKRDQTILFHQRKKELDKLVDQVNNNNVEIKELEALCKSLSEEFSVYIDVNHVFPASVKDLSDEDAKKVEPKVSYYIQSSFNELVHQQNQYIEEVGILFSKSKPTPLLKNIGSIQTFQIAAQPLSPEDIESIDSIFDFSFLWEDDISYKHRYIEILSAYYEGETDYMILNHKFSNDLLKILSTSITNMKDKSEFTPNNVFLEQFYPRIDFFGLLAIFDAKYDNSIVSIYTNHHKILLSKNKDFSKLILSISDLINDYYNNYDNIRDKKLKFINDLTFETIDTEIRKVFRGDFKFKNVFVSSNRFSINRSYSFNDNSDFSVTLGNIEKLGETAKKHSYFFINKWIKIFGIADELVLKPINDTGKFEAILVKDSKETSLSDYGLGTNQLLPIIFSLPIYKDIRDDIFSNPDPTRTLVIEEPEANLHPALQSKLADMFADALARFDLQIIVETHSEYLIRKLQYLSAKHVLQTDDNLSLNPKDISIYYFNSDEYVTDVEPKVKCIHVDVFGGLSDTFGKGFFDEATNLKFQLMNLNKSQSN
jgi:predicted ATPase